MIRSCSFLDVTRRSRGLHWLNILLSPILADVRRDGCGVGGERGGKGGTGYDMKDDDGKRGEQLNSARIG